MDEMLMYKMSEIQKLEPGQIVKSKVIAITDGQVVVNLGLKRDGFVDVADFQTPPEIGSKIDIFIVRLDSQDGHPTISYTKARDIVVWENIDEKFKSKEIIKSKITKKINGGYEVDIEGIFAFMPSSQLSRKYSSQQVIGITIDVKITEFDKGNKNIVVSNRIVELEKSEIQKQKVFSSIKEGDIIKSKITTITNFGIFVDIGGIDGLLHINDVSYKRIENLSQVYKIGDELTVKVLKFDPKKGKVALGLKQLQKNPWDDVEKNYKPGMKVKGKITSLVDFGAFVMLEDGVEGLIHVSDISWTDRIAHPKDIFEEGQVIEAIVADSNAEKKKVSLSYKANFENPFDKYEVGKIAKGHVIKLMDFGCVIQLEQNIHGFIHVSEISKTRVDKPSDVLIVGEDVEGVIIKVDKLKKRIELSIKQYEKEQEKQDIKGFLNSEETKIKFADLIQNKE
ncbi:MAG: S1 RNA-binding domain-containing protein [Elusimicrobiota bacterium]